MDASRKETTDLIGWPSSLPSTPFCAAIPPPLMLANAYRGGIAFDDYWVSEKLDGVRGYWDGTRLLTRNGNRMNPPAWFTEGWPRVAMDGEIWGGRGLFDRTSATVRRSIPLDAAWCELQFMVFDLPRQPGLFTQRLEALTALLEQHPSPWLRRVEQFKVADETQLRARLEVVAARGGEGLMLHRGASSYRADRNDNLLKLKPYEEGEACVIAHLPGKGRFMGMVGALWVERPDGLRFRVGGGLTYTTHRRPPPVGSWIVYQHNGFTPKGLPRFARFTQMCADPPAPQEPAAGAPLATAAAGQEAHPQFCLF